MAVILHFFYILFFFQTFSFLIKFTTRQGLAFWNKHEDTNFDQLLKQCEKLDLSFTEWLDKSQNKFLDNEHQNELINLIALKILEI